MQNANPYAVRSFATSEETRQQLAVLTRAQGVSQSEAIRLAIAEAAARVQRRKVA
ncbi:MAG: ribbon-helix-helix protein, CopG family [Synechococcaceae cyanobacterium]|nr:ribbon-helix-helix protein, CopG family [Synechococcaceae cyanobacterium]